MAPTFSLLAMAALVASVFALPNSPKLEKRTNEYGLTCGNAPGHVGGVFLDGEAGAQSILPSTEPFPETGSSKPEFKYMWCQPGTNTYIFFYYPETSPPPTQYYDINLAFNTSHAIASYQSDNNIARGEFVANPQGSGMQVYMKNYNGGTLTWGIAGSALLGLTYLTQNYPGNCRDHPHNACGPMVFQVNDGEHGEIAIGYAALWTDATEECVLKIEGGNKAKATHCDKLEDLIS